MGAKGRAVGGSELQVRKASFVTGEGRSRTGGSGIQGATLRGVGVVGSPEGLLFSSAFCQLSKPAS